MVCPPTSRVGQDRMVSCSIPLAAAAQLFSRAFSTSSRRQGAMSIPLRYVYLTPRRTRPQPSPRWRRLDAIEARPLDTADDIRQNPFFCACFHPETLKELLHLRRHLRWRQRRDDCFIAGIALGCLHGESHRSERYFSNRMPRTISTKPAYSLRWWKEIRICSAAPKGVRNPQRANRISLCIGTARDPRPGLAQTDAREAYLSFPEMKRRVSLLITSPPYLDTTNF